MTPALRYCRGRATQLGDGCAAEVTHTATMVLCRIRGSKGEVEIVRPCVRLNPLVLFARLYLHCGNPAGQMGRSAVEFYNVDFGSGSVGVNK